jgi:uncharacterized RDD family membrane protein YckC
MEIEPAVPSEPAPVAPVALAEPARVGFWVRGGAIFIDALILTASALLPMQGLSVLVAIAYKTIFISQGGQTPGKMAAGIRVVTETGEPVSLGRAFGRALAEYTSVLTLGIGYVIAAAPDKRALHDYIAGTRVVYLDGVGQGRKAAFAVIGVLVPVLMIAVIGASALLGVGTFGRFKDLAAKAGDGAALGGLGVLRSGLAIYYGDAEGAYPADLETLVPKYAKEIPKAKVGPHMETSHWTAYGAEVCGQPTKFGTAIDASKLKDTGGWGYVADPKAPCWGQVFVDCSHHDSKDVAWPTY